VVLDSREIALAGMLAAIYALGVTLLSPISFEVFQVRIADMLLPLSIIFGLPAVIGLTLGTIVANLSSPFGILDIGGGTVANFIATFLAWKISRRWHFHGSQFVATMVENIIITFIVGSYLQYFIHLPDTGILGVLIPGIVISWLGIFIGSFFAINIAGYALLKALQLRMHKK
jgi:uncharacterized membrane protein